MYVTTQPSIHEPVIRTSASTCSLGLAICILVLALIESGLIVISRFWWAFIAVGLELIAGFLLLVASLSSKYQIYIPFFLLCILSILANIAFMIYGFILGANQLHFDQSSSTFNAKSVNWTSERIQGIFNIALSLLDLFEIFILCLSFVVAVIDTKRLKKESDRKRRPHIAVFSRKSSVGNSVNGGSSINAVNNVLHNRNPREIIEDVEIVEEHCERSIDHHPYY